MIILFFIEKTNNQNFKGDKYDDHKNKIFSAI